MIMEAKEDRPN